MKNFCRIVCLSLCLFPTPPLPVSMYNVVAGGWWDENEAFCSKKQGFLLLSAEGKKKGKLSTKSLLTPIPVGVSCASPANLCV